MAATLPMPGRPAPNTRWPLIVAWLVCLCVLTTVIAAAVLRAGAPPQSPGPRGPAPGALETELEPEAGVVPLPETEFLEPEPSEQPAVPDASVDADATESAEAGAAAMGGAPGLAQAAAAEAGAAGAENEPPPVQCGIRQCPRGQVCCNASCSVCAPPGAQCSQQMCNVPYVPSSFNCGINTCNVGYFCCNASCGICVRPGESCDQRECMNPVQNPISMQCGMNTCNVGYVCCNPSCSLCTLPNEPCSHEICD